MKIVNVLVTFLLFALLLLFAQMFISTTLERVIGDDSALLGQMSAAIIFEGLFSMLAHFAVLVLLIILIRRK